MQPLSKLTEDINLSVANLKRGLKALQREGPQGLEKVLDKLFPGTQRSSPSVPPSPKP
jgi:hypothetical protein